MVYIASWDKFVERSVQLFRADPQSGFLPSRYVMKYGHCDGKLVLKVTDNRECLKFKTDQAQDAKKMEKLNNIFFFTLMARGPDAGISEVSGGAAGIEEGEGKEAVKLHLLSPPLRPAQTFSGSEYQVWIIFDRLTKTGQWYAQSKEGWNSTSPYFPSYIVNIKERKDEKNIRSISSNRQRACTATIPPQQLPFPILGHKPFTVDCTCFALRMVRWIGDMLPILVTNDLHLYLLPKDGPFGVASHRKRI